MWGDEKLDLTIQPDLLATLFTCLDKMLDALYSEFKSSDYNQEKKKNNPTKYGDIPRKGSGVLEEHPKGVSPCKTAEDLIENLPILIRILGVHLGLDANVFLKLLKVCHYFLINQAETHKEIVLKMCGEYFLPAITLMPIENIKVDQELWRILKHEQFGKRYEYYQELLSSGYLSNFCMLSKFIDLYPKGQKWFKSLSTDASSFAANKRSIQQLANSGNMLVLSDTMLFTICNFQDLINPLIIMMEKGSFQDLTLDMTAFSLLRNLTEKQNVYKQLDPLAYVSSDLKNLSDFIG